MHVYMYMRCSVRVFVVANRDTRAPKWYAPELTYIRPAPSRPYTTSSAMYKGASRVRTVEVHVGGFLAATWTSSGTTFDFESIDLSGYSGQYITVTGVLADVEWLSIVEVRSSRTTVPVQLRSRM